MTLRACLRAQPHGSPVRVPPDGQPGPAAPFRSPWASVSTRETHAGRESQQSCRDCLGQGSRLRDVTPGGLRCSWCDNSRNKMQGNVMGLSHPHTTLNPGLWKNSLPQNWSPVPKRLGLLV